MLSINIDFAMQINPPMPQGVASTPGFPDNIFAFTNWMDRLCPCVRKNKTRFYRAMHFSAKRGIAITCRLSVRPSVCLSVCNVGEL